MRRAWLELNYQSANISADIAPDLLSFVFREKGDKEADEITLSLADPSGKWQNAWAVSHGDELHPIIHYADWYQEGDLYRLDCGLFELDEDELSSSSRQGDVITLKALPSAVRRALFSEKKSGLWESANLRRVAQDLAERNELVLVYQAGEIALKRVDQRQETDLAFLQRLCTDHGCRLRVTEGRLVVTDAARADAAAPIVLNRQAGDSLNSRRSKHDVYSRAVITYTDPHSGRTARYAYPHAGKATETGKELTINQRVANYVEAEQVARAALRDKNAKQQSAGFNGQDRPEARAGATVRLEGWGVYGGLLVIKQAEHSLSGQGAARCRLTLEKTLEY